MLAAVLFFIAAAVFDLARPPERQLSARAFVVTVQLYQRIGHRLFPRGQCRFSPTCSSYAEIVVRDHGTLEGGWLTARRLLRCGPWTPQGTKDPPPIRDSGPESQ